MSKKGRPIATPWALALAISQRAPPGGTVPVRAAPVGRRQATRPTQVAPLE